MHLFEILLTLLCVLVLSWRLPSAAAFWSLIRRPSSGTFALLSKQREVGEGHRVDLEHVHVHRRFAHDASVILASQHLFVLILNIVVRDDFAVI